MYTIWVWLGQHQTCRIKSWGNIKHEKIAYASVWSIILFGTHPPELRLPKAYHPNGVFVGCLEAQVPS